MSSDPEYAGLIAAANRDVDRIRAAVESAAADETMRKFAAVSLVASSAAALIANMMPATATALPVSAIALLSLAGPMYLAQQVSFVDRQVNRQDSSIGK